MPQHCPDQTIYYLRLEAQFPVQQLPLEYLCMYVDMCAYTWSVLMCVSHSHKRRQSSVANSLIRCWESLSHRLSSCPLLCTYTLTYIRMYVRKCMNLNSFCCGDIRYLHFHFNLFFYFFALLLFALISCCFRFFFLKFSFFLNFCSFVSLYTCIFTALLSHYRILYHFLCHIKHPQPTSQRYLKAIAPRHHHHHQQQQPGPIQSNSASKHQLTQFSNPFALLRRKIAVGRSVEVAK